VTVSVAHAVDTIWTSARAGVHFPEPLKGRLSPELGYRAQLGVLERHVAAGDAHVGWKVGLTSRATQDAFGRHEPAFGYLLRSGARTTGAVFPIAAFPCGFENELCLTIGAPLQGPGVTLAQARTAIVAVAPALEIVEIRGDLGGDFGLALADNLFQKAFVTGEATRPLAAHVDLGQAIVDVFVNGRHCEQARGAEVLGNPAASVAWLANKLAEFGRRLEAGMQVMSGSITRLYPVQAGDAVEARFQPFGRVAARFTADAERPPARRGESS
jgi:2-keto-4-pentenoate hydratase